MGRGAGHHHRGGRIGGRLVRQVEPGDRQRLVELTLRHWGSTRMAARGRLFDVTTLPGYLAIEGDEWLGHAAYEVVGGSLEVAILRSYRLAAIRLDAVTRARARLKPEIPLTGDYGIPLRDELELQLPPEEWPRVVERWSWPAG